MGPLNTYGGTPKAGSVRHGTSAIHSAVADLPLGHILRVRGVLVETWQGEGNSIFLGQIDGQIPGSGKTGLPDFCEKVRALSSISFENYFKNPSQSVSNFYHFFFDPIIGRGVEPLGLYFETPHLGSRV